MCRKCWSGVAGEILHNLRWAIICSALVCGGIIGSVLPAAAQSQPEMSVSGGVSGEIVPSNNTVGLPVDTDFGTVDTASPLTRQFDWARSRPSGVNGALADLEVARARDFTIDDNVNWSITPKNGVDDPICNFKYPWVAGQDMVCLFDVTFQPRKGNGREYFATITITHSGANSPYIINLKGTSTGADLPDPDPEPEVIAEDAQTGRFIMNRASNILQNQPDLIPFLDGSRAGTPGAMSGHANDFGGTVDFTTSLSQMTGSSSDAAGRYYDIWVDVHGTWSNNDDAEQDFYSAYIGGHVAVSPNFLIGAMAQVDRAEETDSSLNSKIDGTGWLAGPYVVGRFADEQLYIELRSLWGGSGNSIKIGNGTASDFDTDQRWLLHSKIRGHILMSGLKISPDVSVAYYQERRKAFTTASGGAVAAENYSFGEATFGASVSKDIQTEGGAILTPSIAVHGVDNFGVSQTAQTAEWTLASDNFRARFDAGLSAALPGGLTLSAGGFYDGLGASGYESYGGNIGASKAF